MKLDAPPFGASAALLPRVARFTALSLVFALIYAQSPLYTSNQNQYFLHGLARAGVGRLTDDWLTGTKDPTPVFSLLVEATSRLLGPVAFYFEYALVLGVYLVSLLALVSAAGLLPQSRRAEVMFAVCLVAIHSAAFRFGLQRGIGPDWEFVFEAGVASQRLLGAVFQPSVFGVFLLASLACYLRGRPYLAAICAAVAATVHPTYLLASGVLVLTFAALTVGGEKRWARAVAFTGLALALVLPILGYVAVNFAPNGPDIVRQAQAILISRIPHHAVPAKWPAAPIAFQGLILIAGLFLCRRSKLFPLLALSTAVSLGLSILQIVTGSSALALLFPWRLSAFLVPAATAVVLSRGVTLLLPHLQSIPNRIAVGLATLILALLSLAGAARFVIELGQIRQEPARPMFRFVENHLAMRDVYLSPPKLDPFRLATGAPIVVDAKSIPYRDLEVIEWAERLRLAQFFYRDRVAYMDCDLLDDFQRLYRVTHIVLGPEQLGLTCDWEEIFRDDSYAVYRLPEP